MSFTAAPRRAPTSVPNSAPPSASSDPISRRTGWGAGSSSRTDFDPAAAAAFGKKPARIEAPPPESTAPPPRVAPPRNTLASALDGILPDDPAPKAQQWSKSALQQQREAAKAEAAKKAAPPPKTFDEEFPTLGGAGGVSKAPKPPKPVISLSSDTKKPAASTSFATLAASWAKADDEKRYLEAIAAKKRAEQLALQEFENADRMRYYRNLNANRAYDAGGDGYYEDDYDNEYVEGELDEQDYSAADVRAEKRAMQRRYEEHYSDEGEEEEDEY